MDVIEVNNWSVESDLTVLHSAMHTEETDSDRTQEIRFIIPSWQLTFKHINPNVFLISQNLHFQCVGDL